MKYTIKFATADGSTQSKEFQAEAFSTVEFIENFVNVLPYIRQRCGNGRFRVSYFVPGRPTGETLPLALRNMVAQLPKAGLNYERTRGGVILREPAQVLDLNERANYTIADKYPQPVDTADFEKAQRDAFDVFVGTYPEVLAEREALTVRIAAELKRLRDAYDAKLEAQVSRYWEQAFAEQPGITPRVLNFLHSLAYDRGHSAGHGEIYAYFVEGCENYRELKRIEKEEGS